MSWDKIKKAVNSSIGTGDFKPLDKLIVDSFNEIKIGLKQGEIKPLNATQAEYASSDKSKGTIENRLLFVESYIAANIIFKHSIVMTSQGQAISFEILNNSATVLDTSAKIRRELNRVAGTDRIAASGYKGEAPLVAVRYGAEYLYGISIAGYEVALDFSNPTITDNVMRII